MPDLALSTWSLHRTLGATYPALDVHCGARAAHRPYGDGSLTLIDAPAYVAEMGIHALEICHFHFPSTDAAYLDDVRERLEQADVRLMTLLIDGGDIAAVDQQARARDLRRIEAWIDVAARVGAARVRVVAGATPPDAEGRAIRASSSALVELAAYARERGVDVITENWQALTERPEHLLAILDATDGDVGLCADFGNCPAATREQDLRAILPRAVTVHAKADWVAPGAVDAVAFRRCLDLTRDAGFEGPYVVIFDDAGDERASILQLADLVRPYLR